MIPRLDLPASARTDDVRQAPYSSWPVPRVKSGRHRTIGEFSKGRRFYIPGLAFHYVNSWCCQSALASTHSSCASFTPRVASVRKSATLLSEKTRTRRRWRRFYAKGIRALDILTDKRASFAYSLAWQSAGDSLGGLTMTCSGDYLLGGLAGSMRFTHCRAGRYAAVVRRL